MHARLKRKCSLAFFLAKRKMKERYTVEIKTFLLIFIFYPIFRDHQAKKNFWVWLLIFIYLDTLGYSKNNSAIFFSLNSEAEKWWRIFGERFRFRWDWKKSKEKRRSSTRSLCLSCERDRLPCVAHFSVKGSMPSRVREIVLVTKNGKNFKKS